MFFQLLAGFALLLGGGELLIRGAAALALRFGLSHLVVGIVIVGFGTSAPELVASVQAALAGAPGIAIGNVVGSNVANILLILGAGAVIYPVMCSPSAIYRDGLVVMLVAVLLGFAAWTGMITRLWGVAFVGLLIAYLAYLILQDRRKENWRADEEPDIPAAAGSAWLEILMTAGGVFAVVFGGKLLVSGAVDVARSFNVSDEVVGLTLVAIGTSLPELATSVMAALRKHSDIALGNVLGSNVYNVLGIAGITAVISPIPVSSHMISQDIPVMIAITLGLFVLLILRRSIGRLAGLLFLAGYAVFVAVLVV